MRPARILATATILFAPCPGVRGGWNGTPAGLLSFMIRSNIDLRRQPVIAVPISCTDVLGSTSHYA